MSSVNLMSNSSLPPDTASSQRTAAYAMDDLESGQGGYNNKRPGITIEAKDTAARPPLGRRKTTNEEVKAAVDAHGRFNDAEEDTLGKIGAWLWRVHNASIVTRYALYVLPVGAILAVPLALSSMHPKLDASGDPVNHSWMIGQIRLLGLFTWLEIAWVSLWICKIVAHFIPLFFGAVAGVVSTGVRKYTQILQNLEIPVSLFLWSIVNFATSTKVIIAWCNESERLADPKRTLEPISLYDQCHPRWQELVSKVFKAGIIAAALFLAEKTFVQVVSVNYHRKQYGQKIKESKHLVWLLDLLYDASRTLFPEFCREFEQEDEEITGNSLEEIKAAFGKAGVGTKIFSQAGRARDKATAAFGAMVADISGKQAFASTSAHSIVIEALETEKASKALARRLWLSFVGEGRTELYKHDLIEVLGREREEQCTEIFAALDRDGNGDVSLEEMTMLVVNAGQERKNRQTSMQDVASAIGVLDKMLSLVVLVAIAIIYAIFFSASFASSIATLWTTFTGLAFAIGGTVTEFLSCCIFLFVKHPYDVGDRVDINDAHLIVEHISLMYSVFRRVDSDKTVQIPHQIANTLWIENISRSRAMKERLTFSVSPATSNEDILALRSELQRFVTADENRRDFRDEVDIELLSVGNMEKLDLQVEIRHKSNWSNELQRATRRNKFMCELLSIMRKIPIDPPGGSAAPSGDPSNPAYSVTVSDSEAAEARAKAAAAAEEKRMFPVGSGAMYMEEAKSSSFQKPADDMIAGIAGRRNGSLHGARPSSEGRRSSGDTRSTATGYTHGGYGQPPVQQQFYQTSGR